LRLSSFSLPPNGTGAQRRANTAKPFRQISPNTIDAQAKIPERMA
jgi:hypothetical protein